MNTVNAMFSIRHLTLGVFNLFRMFGGVRNLMRLRATLEKITANGILLDCCFVSHKNLGGDRKN